MLDEQDNE